VRPPRSPVMWMIGAFGLATNAQITFLVPLRAHELGASLQLIGLIMAAGAALPAFTAIPAGSVIDRVGSRQCFILATALCGLMVMVLPAVTNPWLFLPLVPVLGLARNLGWQASQTYIAGLSAEGGGTKVTGLFGMSSSIGQTIGPILVGVVGGWLGLRWGFFLTGGYALIFTAMGMLLPHTVKVVRVDTGPKFDSGFRTALGLLTLRPMQVILLMTFARIWSNRLYTVFAPVNLVARGVDPGTVGVVMAVSGLVGGLFAPTADLLSQRVRPIVVAATGLAIASIGLMLSPMMTSSPMFLIPSVLSGVGAGLSLPILLSTIGDAAPEGARGVAVGLRGTANQTAATIAPVSVGPVIAAAGFGWGLGLAGVVSLVMLAVSQVASFLDNRRSPEDPDLVDDDVGTALSG
jgi:MFS family permease